MSDKMRVLTILAGIAALIFAGGLLCYLGAFDGPGSIQRSQVSNEWAVYRIEAKPGTFRVYNSPGDSLHPPRMDSLAFRMPDSSEVKVTVRWDLPAVP